MNVYLINKKNDKLEITETITSLTISGEYRSCCRTLGFGIIKSKTDKNTHLINIDLGDNIQVVEKGKILFHGVVWDKDKLNSSNEISIQCRDFGIYLLKNRSSYKFKNITPEGITKKVCSDFGIKTGNIISTGNPINRIYLGNTLYDIIMSSYTLANDKKYMCIFEGDKLSIVEKGITKCKQLDSETNLLDVSISESLNNMVNRVNVYSKDDKLIKTLEENNNIKLYGVMSEYLKIHDDKEDYNLKAKKMLNGIEQKISVDNFGDVSYITGRSVIVKEPYQGLKGLFFIDADKHNCKNGIYTNKLTLNFKNLMDERESGTSE